MKASEFINPQLQHQYEDNGYVHIRGLLDGHDIDLLNRLFNNHYDHNNKNSCLWNSLCDIPHDKSALLSRDILNVVRPKLEQHLKNYVCPAATFLVKPPAFESTVNLHRDFSVQDELEFSYQNIWIPIVDTTPENGQLHVLTKSHKFFNYPLPHNTVWPYLEVEDILLEQCNVIDAKAGDLIIYGDKVLHGSSKNITSLPRPVVHFGILHPKSKLLYHYLNTVTNEVTMYEVPYSFFFENAWGNQDGRFPIFKKFDYSPPKYSKSEILNWIETEVKTNNKAAA